MAGMINGIINVNKAAGMTSHDAVAILRRVFGQKRIGHTGTLDPMVTGVLPICLGRATKLAEYISGQGKVYFGRMRLGISTDTQDITGTVIAQGGGTVFTRERILDVFRDFTGEIMQCPPMYSAVKVDGKRLYELARAGKTVERRARLITIHALTLLEISGDEIAFRCACSKGTYIRQLVVDIAEALGTYGVLMALERIQVGPYRIADAVDIGALKGMTAEEAEMYIRPMDEAIGHAPALVLNARRGALAEHGVRLTLNDTEAQTVANIPDDTLLRVYRTDKFLGIGHLIADESGRRLIIDKVLAD